MSETVADGADSTGPLADVINANTAITLDNALTVSGNETVTLTGIISGDG